jgi:hypothetical protein
MDTQRSVVAQHRAESGALQDRQCDLWWYTHVLDLTAIPRMGMQSADCNARVPSWLVAPCLQREALELSRSK